MTAKPETREDGGETGEGDRDTGEDDRETGEGDRETWEGDRDTGEDDRDTGEDDRDTGEDDRGTGEDDWDARDDGEEEVPGDGAAMRLPPRLGGGIGVADGPRDAEANSRPRALCLGGALCLAE
ncbi:hypothetical protein ABN034_05525 [Actinopolymorpha sp. B11F2]|uniref:hypothetical protein n=1 Tax=Actinopolymorpha sp. B11F2 TaxID=3160862 RepID=UPI0032E48F59